MSNQLDELKSLVATITADRQAQKDKEKREAWTKFVSLSTIIIAVLAAIATQRGAGYSSASMKKINEATLLQAQASDQWAFYQAKGIKKSIQEQERDRLKAQANVDQKVLAGVVAKVERYDKEQKEITDDAKKLEAKRDDAAKEGAHAGERSREMGLATTIFQIALALGGVTLIVKKRILWFASLAAGLISTVQMVRVMWWM